MPEVQSREEVTPQEVTPVDPSEAAGSFMLVVDTKESLIIVPELVYYRENMTVKDALKASGHTFVGIDGGYVTEIDGFKPESGFLVSTETGGWDASVQASTIKLFRYSTNFGEPDYQMPMSDALKALYDVMIEYLKSTKHNRMQPPKRLTMLLLQTCRIFQMRRQRNIRMHCAKL